MVRLLLGGHADGFRTRKLMAHLGSIHMSALFTCRKRRTPSSCMHARMRPAHAFSRNFSGQGIRGAARAPATFRRAVVDCLDL